MLNEKMDVYGSHERVHAYRIMVPVMNSLQARSRMRSWNVPTRLHPVEKPPSHVIHFLLNAFMDPFSFGRKHQILLIRRLPTWQASSYELKMKIVVAAKGSAIGKILKKPDIFYSGDERGFICSTTSENGSYCWKTLRSFCLQTLQIRSVSLRDI